MFRLSRFLSVAMIAVLVAACTSSATNQVTSSVPTSQSTEAATVEAALNSTEQSATEAPTQAADSTAITLFLGYIPNVQFAPVYVALEKGYFKEQGIEVKLEHSFDETDGVTRIAANQLKFGLISGDQALLARAQGAPVTYVFRWYQKFPVGVVVPETSDIKTPEDLAGKIVGVPGKFGASYVGLQALLYVAKLKESDLKEVKAIGFDTAPVVCGKQVEASVVYVANEPALIEATCFKVRVIKISDFANIMSNGLITNEETIKNEPDLVKGMNAALAQGLADTIAAPKSAYEISRKYVETLGADDPVQMAVLENSLELWKTDKYGYSDPDAWQLTYDTLKEMGLLTGPVELDKVYSNDYLP